MKNILKSLAASAIAIVGVAGATLFPTGDGSDAVTTLLAEARSRSSQVSVDWKAYAKDPNLKWASDAAEVAHLRDDISAAAKTIAGLNGCRSQASSAQIATLDRIIPVMEEMVDGATSAVDYLNRNQARLTVKEYREYLDANSDTSTRLAGLVSKLLDFGNSREKFENARRTLAAK